MLEFFGDGGPFMWPLGLWSIMGLAFFIERVFTYARMRSEDELSEVTNDLTSRIDSGASFEQLREHCGELGKLEGEVYAETIQRFEHVSREQRSIEEMRVEMNGTVERVADTDLAVLITGENGTGKEVVSRMIHFHSRRRKEPLVAVNCAALTETLLESELFGHVKGAFTDAHEDREGKFELASGGTLLLDEIGDMSPGGQSKLLRVLEEKTVVRVGGSTPIRTDARVIAATNQDLAGMVRDKLFREDLFYRLNVVTIELPPLRQRGDDVLLLAKFFLEQFSAQAGRTLPRLMKSACQRLQRHNWPGNIRELRNLMERLVYLFQGDKIEAEDLDFVLSPDADTTAVSMDLALNEATQQFQIQYIQKQIERSGNNVSEAARQMGMHRSNLYRKMRQLGMEESV